jgi:coproporphyrinogen III oxidase-like Fe-S oxidoreductase
MATVRHRKPENWLSAVARNGHGAQAEEPLTPADRAKEGLLMGLRLREGIDLGRIAMLGAAPIATLVDEAAIARLADQGFIVRSGDHLRVREAGMLLLDAILPAIVAG